MKTIDGLRETFELCLDAFGFLALLSAVHINDMLMLHLCAQRSLN